MAHASSVDVSVDSSPFRNNKFILYSIVYFHCYVVGNSHDCFKEVALKGNAFSFSQVSMNVLMRSLTIAIPTLTVLIYLKGLLVNAWMALLATESSAQVLGLVPVGFKRNGAA